MEEEKPARPLKAVEVRRNAGEAEEVVAAGSGPAAQALVARARKLGMEVRRDPDLVERMTSGDPAGTIPARLYEVVAEVVTFVAQLTELESVTNKIGGGIDA